MPVRPNLLERLLLFRLEMAPGPILDLFGAGGFEAVCLAIDVGVFETLSGEPLSASDLATRLEADENGIETLLAFLAAQGYVAEDGGRYRNTSMTETWLTPASKTNVAPWFAFWRDLVFPFWRRHLETTVREGEPPKTIYEWFDEEPGRWETAQRGFRAAASVVVEEVADKLSVPDGPARVLDVGGGHGLFAIELCRRRPDLEAMVFDHPEALDVAREEIAAAGLEDQIAVQGGDYWTDDLGDGYDLALVFNVVHAHHGEANVRLFERVGDALAPGGTVAVLDQFEGTGRTPVGRAGVAFVDLTYLVTLGAAAHPYDDVADWLRAAGFGSVRRTSIRRAGPGNTLVEATLTGAGR